MALETTLEIGNLSVQRVLPPTSPYSTDAVVVVTVMSDDGLETDQELTREQAQTLADHLYLLTGSTVIRRKPR